DWPHSSIINRQWSIHLEGAWMRNAGLALIVIVVCTLAAKGTERAMPQEAAKPLNIIAFGAHPDDCDLNAGGVAAKWAAAGHHVRFVSVTNGDAGHQEQGGAQLGARRRA